MTRSDAPLRKTIACLVLGPLAAISAAGHAHASESRATQAHALVLDIERIVSSAEVLGWFSDRRALSDTDDALLESICRVSPEVRQLALAELLAKAQQVGDPRKLFEASSGELTGDVERAITVDRQLMALRFALERVDEDCPFWVVPDPDFRGRQLLRNRFVVAVQSEGNIALSKQDGTWTYGGGGSGRVMPGWGFGGGVTLLGGGEFGGGALLRPNTEARDFAISYVPAIPLVLRVHYLDWHFDTEGAATMLLEADNLKPSYGLRGGVGVGYSALRTRSFVPWIGVAFNYGQFLPNESRSRIHTLAGRLDAGVLWDP